MSRSTANQAVPAIADCPFTIEVQGEGTATAAPDRAVIVLGAVTEGLVLQKVQTDNAAVVTNIVNALLGLGIPRERIQTYDYRIEMQYDYEGGKQTFRSYKVTHLLKITEDRTGMAGAVVDTAVASGANTVASVRFEMAHPERYVDEALKMAVRDAWRKASAIADAAGVVLFAVPCEVKELARGPEPVPYAPAMLAAGPATPIQPGQLNVYAAVRVTYAYR